MKRDDQNNALDKTPPCYCGLVWCSANVFHFPRMTPPYKSRTPGVKQETIPRDNLGSGKECESRFFTGKIRAIFISAFFEDG
ncbi:hypothetical protein JTE90_026138 [Oedothorax gibbosus]|uniref:Uncharacterized protein n=1 Tax=Oedothorax gibbosus TaxID=931172 RepID=A0AAV6UZF0_9ARAC|nr:hypothetical protein JTE90_026138 [Oedothorax gibbosus]